MSTPTVASLCASLGEHLRPAPGFDVVESEVTAVHISELVDPGAYLTGGELLLTTGLNLPMTTRSCNAYAARLKKAEISALALGLGPAHSELPEALADACRTHGLVLLVVPGPTPFLKISRAYWHARSHSTERALNDAVAAHRALVDAAVAPDPQAAILRRLAKVIDGWAAMLDPSGELDQAYPLSAARSIDELRTEVDRLDMAGVHSSASFAMGDQVVVVFPLAVEDRVVGYLAAGTDRRRLEARQRHLVLAAAALLSADVQRHQHSESARAATRRCVALLLEAGMTDAARRLAPEAGYRVLAQEMSVIAVRSRNCNALVSVVQGARPDALAVETGRSEAWFLLPDDQRGVPDLTQRLLHEDPSATAVLSDIVGLDHLGAVRARTVRALDELTPGEIVVPQVVNGQDVHRAVERFASRAPAEVHHALASYLRCHRHWETAARALNLHRNTLRYRVSRARDILDLDLEDPDVAAQTWLALRSRGLA